VIIRDNDNFARCTLSITDQNEAAGKIAPVKNGAQGRSLSAIRGLRDTGASLHIGIEQRHADFQK
jgi:hypothetical protein